MLTAQTIRKYKTTLSHSGQPLNVGDKYYVHDLHGQDGQDAVLRLQQAIEDTEGSGLYYFTGQRGTGKSTELRRLAVLLEGQNCRCIHFDALDYLNDTQPIDAYMLMLMVGAGIDDWISDRYPEKDSTAESPITRFGCWLNTQIQFEKIQLSVPGLGATFDLKPLQKSLSEQIRTLGDPQRLHRNLIDFISDLCRRVAKREAREKIVVIVDSLENLRGNPLAGDGQNTLFASVLEVFADRFELIKIPDVHTVYSVPPYLCLLANIRPQVSWTALASVRVCQPPDPAGGRRQPRAEGLDLMREVLVKRLPDWQDILSEAAFERLALLSGGDLRQFIVRLLVDVLHQAQFSLNRLPLAGDDPIIKDVEAACASEMLQLTVEEEWPLLKAVATRNNIIAPNREQIKTLAHLLDTKIILNYRNGHDWYDLHPTLWPVIDALPDTTSVLRP